MAIPLPDTPELSLIIGQAAQAASRTQSLDILEPGPPPPSPSQPLVWRR